MVTLSRLVVQTRRVAPADDLLEYTSAARPLAWLRRGDGIVGAGGVVLRLDGRDAADLAEAWRAVAEAAIVEDEVRLPGTGLVAFGALAFDPENSAAPNTLVVPAAVVGRRREVGWVTRIHLETGPAPSAVRPSSAPASPSAPVPVPYGPYWAGTLGPGALSPAGYQEAVRRALAALDDDEVGKVVLARDLVGSVPADADLRRLARALSTGYPDTWTYAVDGIIGASPETLVTVAAGTVTARVLAGTTPRGADADADAAASHLLATSSKDLDEHEYAVQSVLASLRPHTSALAAAEQPSALKLPNLWHLATDLEGDLADGSSALELVAALHPTAAVAGTPTLAALTVIRRLEPFDRGRYAGPVGWVDQHGDGEWAIALRCAQFAAAAAAGEGIPVVAHAGAGIVLGSEPESELLETRIKFRPIVEALA